MEKGLTEEIGQAIQQRLAGGKLICRVCGGTRWRSNGIINLHLSGDPNVLVIGGKHLPLVDMTCQVCGLTQFHNIIVLIGRERFNEIAEQQKAVRQAVEEAENIIKQKEVKGE